MIINMKYRFYNFFEKFLFIQLFWFGSIPNQNSICYDRFGYLPTGKRIKSPQNWIETEILVRLRLVYRFYPNYDHSYCDAL